MHPASRELIRPDVIGDLTLYAQRGVPLGSFLQAVVANDLIGACGMADDENIRSVVAIAAYVYNMLPMHCWGSRRVYHAYVAWHAAGTPHEVDADGENPPTLRELQDALDESRNGR